MAGSVVRRAVIWSMVAIFGGSAARLVLGPASHAGQEEQPSAPAAGLPPELVELVAAHNRERAAEKLGPLTANAKLSAAALLHARDMAEQQKMTHVGRDGSKFNERIERQGYVGRRLGENICAGQSTVEQAMESWMTSPPHRHTILDQFSEIGVAYATSAEGKRYWCATFGLPPMKLAHDEAAAGLVAAVNAARMEAGKPPMRVSPRLSNAAQKVADSLAALGDLHKGQTSYAAEVIKTGYKARRLGEAAASGHPTPEDVLKSWIDEPIHRENFLGRFSEIGVGYTFSEKEVPFWMVFLALPAK